MRSFSSKDIWTIDTSKLSNIQSFGIHILRLFSVLLRGIFRKELQEKAALLAYYTLISILPILAFLLLLSRGFLMEETFVSFIRNSFPSQSSIIMEFIQFAKKSIELTSHKAVIGISVILFLWSTYKILYNLELAMNQIFEARKGRSFIRRCSDYVTVNALVPFLLSLATITNFYLSAKLPGLDKWTSYFIGLQLFSYFLISFLFVFLYLFLPNTQVQFFPALWGGLIAGLLYQIFQALYLIFQITFSRYNPVIGTLAGIPIFLLWLQLSWLILLLGARIAVYFQNIDAYEFAYVQFRLNHKCKVIVSLEISHLCIKRFCEGGDPLNVKEISKKLKISRRLTKMILFELVDAKVLIEVKNAKEKVGYLPASDVEQLTIKRVLDMINENGDSIPLFHAEEISKRLENFEKLIEKSKDNIALKNI